MAEIPESWANLIDALTLMAKHPMNVHKPTNCGHDVLWVCADDSLFTADEIAQLDAWGFFPSSDGGFMSYKYGSA